jgi:hypothetical protein
MNLVLQRQNEQLNLRKLAAQRALYSRAKKVQAWQLVLVVVLSTVLALAAIWHESIAGQVALYSLFITLADFLGFEPAIASIKKQAAQIQESFDCSVLDIECSVFKAGDPEIEDVLVNSDALFKLKTDVEKLRNWYSAEIEPLSIGLSRLVCQRSNFQWDTGLRNDYNSFLLIPAISLIAAVSISCLAQDVDFEHFVLITAAILPALLFFLKQRQQNQEAMSRLGQLAGHFRNVWQKANASTLSEVQLSEAARQIQDEIYDHRVQSPLVPDFYYWLRRKKDEWTMNRAAKQYAAPE